jgi:hypothetical protein
VKPEIHIPLAVVEGVGAVAAATLKEITAP